MWDSTKDAVAEALDTAKTISCEHGLVLPPTAEWLTNKKISKLASHTGSYMRKGASGDHVKLVQRALYYWGCKVLGEDLLPVFGPDGSYGKETKTAVKRFQTEHHLAHDGTVGWNTFDALDVIVRGKLDSEGEPEEKNREFYLQEGADLIERANFGWSAGEVPGKKDPHDAYDPRYWREVKGVRTIRAKTTPWVAMNMLLRYIDKPIPSPFKKGEHTRWNFECFEASHVVSVYADWKIMDRNMFDSMYTPLEFGMFAANDHWLETTVTFQDTSGGPVYTVQTPDPSRPAAGEKVYLVGTMDEYVAGAPIDSLVILAHPAAQRKCKKLGGSGDVSCNIKFENTVKIGDDLYSAHPWGAISLLEVITMMRNTVADPHYEVFVKEVRYPEPE